jgi:hypothetical protein
MLVAVTLYRRTDRAGGWNDGRRYTYPLPVECLLFIAEWSAGENRWQHPERLTAYKDVR